MKHFKFVSLLLVISILISCTQNIVQTSITTYTKNTLVSNTESIIPETKEETIEKSRQENIITQKFETTHQIEESIKTISKQDTTNFIHEITVSSTVTKETIQSMPKSTQQATTISETEHKHKFKLSETIESTCSKEGQKIVICDCGEKDIEVIEKISHEYKLIETNTEELFKLYMCSKCCDSYKEKINSLKAIDTDKCGESLIEKILPHASYPDLMQITLDLYHSHYSEFDYDSVYVLLEGMHYTQLQQLFFTSYRYLGENIHFFGSQTLDETPCIRVYCTSEEDELAQTVYNEAKRILAELNITNKTTQKEAITKINEWICDQKEYDYDAQHDVTKRNGSMYYSLFSDKGVCTNYAIAFQILCLSAGIECHYYSSSTMNHAWNKVYFSDGSYRWVDVTWNDTTGTLKYLLITDEQLLKDHSL